MKKNIIAMMGIGLIMLAGLSACSSNEDIQQNEFIPIPLTDIEKEVASNSRNIGIDMLSYLSKQNDGNIVFSPLNLSTAMAMLANGANGETLDELLNVINSVGTLDDINSLYYKLIANLPAIDKTTDIAFANSLWINNETGANPSISFLSSLNDFYKITPVLSNITSTSAMEQINAWCSNATHGLIKNFIQSPLPDNTSVFLASALYFNGRWKTPFDKSKTKTDLFYNDGVNAKEVDMMNGDIEMRALEADSYKAVRMPFGNEAYSLCVVLPNQGVDVNDCILHMKDKEFHNFLIGYSPSMVHVKMPKLSIETESNVINGLKSLGVSSIFDQKKCDLKKISNGCFISDIIHKLTLNIDEEGARMAVATGFKGELADAPAAGEMNFFVDHPFIIMITEKSTMVPLALGIIRDIP